jgi:hypothetical protein
VTTNAPVVAPLTLTAADEVDASERAPQLPGVAIKPGPADGLRGRLDDYPTPNSGVMVNQVEELPVSAPTNEGGPRQPASINRGQRNTDAAQAF